MLDDIGNIQETSQAHTCLVPDTSFQAMFGQAKWPPGVSCARDPIAGGPSVLIQEELGSERPCPYCNTCLWEACPVSRHHVWGDRHHQSQ